MKPESQNSDRKIRLKIQPKILTNILTKIYANIQPIILTEFRQFILSLTFFSQILIVYKVAL